MDIIALDAVLKGHDADNNLKGICDRIDAGDVFIYPTETIYGIGGRADKDEVRQRILKAKKRKLDHSMIILAGKKETFSQCNVDFPPAAKKLSNHFWPGFLTLVLPIKNEKETLGVRVSNHPFIQAIFTKIHMPIFSTSANISGTEYKNNPEEIYSIFSHGADFMIDAGKLPPSPPSTVVSVSRDNTVTIVREGAISREEIGSVINRPATGQRRNCKFK
jgi:Sua5/YciO/YrdC/YwlC family protein